MGLAADHWGLRADAHGDVRPARPRGAGPGAADAERGVVLHD